MSEEIPYLIMYLPQIFMYFVPGAIFLSVNSFICSKKSNEYQYFIFKSIVISYVIINITEFLQLVLNQPSTMSTPFFSIIIAVLMSYILSVFYISNKFEKFLELFNINKTIHDNIWNDIIDYEKGTYIQVYIPTEKIVYQGYFQKHEEKDCDAYITISNYIVKKYDDSIISNYKEVDTEVVVLNTKNISRIELTYSKDSLKI